MRNKYSTLTLQKSVKLRFRNKKSNVQALAVNAIGYSGVYVKPDDLMATF